MDILLGGLIIFSTALVDGIYVLYTKFVVDNSPFKSATFGSIIHLINAFVVIEYTRDWHYIFCVFFGSWIGTYATVHFFRIRQIRKRDL